MFRLSGDHMALLGPVEPANALQEREAGSLLTSQLSVVVVFFTVLSPFDCYQCVLILFLMYSQSMVTPSFKIAKGYINSLQ